MYDYMYVRLINQQYTVIEVRIVVGSLMGKGHKGTLLGDGDTLHFVRVLVTYKCKYIYILVDIENLCILPDVKYTSNLWDKKKRFNVKLSQIMK